MTTSVQQSSQSRAEMFRRAQNGLIVGGKIMLLQTPFVTSLNRISVVSCYSNLSAMRSAKAIYRGEVDGYKKPSVIHFSKGVSGHVFKEVSRLGFKTYALVHKAFLDAHFQNNPKGKIKSDLIFAGGLSLGEMLINPADTLRTMWQAGEKLSHIEKGKKFFHLYKGAGANGVRQFGIWVGYPFSERVWTKVVEEITSIDPHELTGIALKSIPQSFQITTPVWLFERVKNELQYHPKLNQTEKRTSRYIAAFNHILRTQGWGGFCRGFIPKVWGNALLVIGADYLLEQGRKAQKV